MRLQSFFLPWILVFQDRMILQEFDLGIDPHPTNPYNHLLGVLEIQSIYNGQDPDTCIAEIQFSPKTYVWEDFMDGTWHTSSHLANRYPQERCWDFPAHGGVTERCSFLPFVKRR